MKKNCAVVIVAAGASKRLKSEIRKPFIEINNTSLLMYSIESFIAFKEISEIILVVHKNDINKTKNLLKQFGKNDINFKITSGGKERADSVLKGISSLSKNIDYILVHDAARPFVKKNIIKKILNELKHNVAVIPVISASDTVKYSKDGKFVYWSLDRKKIFFSQTPQGFKKDHLTKSINKFKTAWRKFTDESQLFELQGAKVKMIPGDRLNLKITFPEDLLLADVISKNFK